MVTVPGFTLLTFCGQLICVFVSLGVMIPDMIALIRKNLKVARKVVEVVPVFMVYDMIRLNLKIFSGNPPAHALCVTVLNIG